MILFSLLLVPVLVWTLWIFKKTTFVPGVILPLVGLILIFASQYLLYQLLEINGYNYISTEDEKLLNFYNFSFWSSLLVGLMILLIFTANIKLANKNNH